MFFTLIFGTILPALYPLALFGILAQYTADRLLLTHFYRMPPKYSEQLTLQNINLMFMAPILGLMVNFWAFGNRQMFENKIDAISTQGEISYSHHILTHSANMPVYPHLE